MALTYLGNNGWGSPTLGGAPDLGWGSPTTNSSADAGHGEPSGSLAIIMQVVSGTEYTDDGGPIVTLQGDVGPYTAFWVRLVDGDDQEWPAAPDFAWSTIPSAGGRCPVLANGEEIRFGLPAVPTGIYSVRLYTSNAGGTLANAVNQIEIKRRVYYGSTYRQRGMFPSWWEGAGPRLIQNEPDGVA